MTTSNAATGRPAQPGTYPTGTTAEHRRLAESAAWRHWGPYLSGRQWGTVREDYSADGNAWEFFPFDHAHKRAYRWGEDGLGGFCDEDGLLNFGVALWNGQDDRLKERYFGLTNSQGNHGEDVKEYWWPLDATPTHSWADWLYRYPQAAFPYSDLVRTNAARTRNEPEYELSDTGILADNRFFDIQVSHAKASPEDICITITATNHGPDAAPLDLVPQLWFRNTWSWGRDPEKPAIRVLEPADASADHVTADHVTAEASHAALGRYFLAAEGSPRMLFCDNETNTAELYGADPAACPFPKNGIDRAIVHGDESLLSPSGSGTKMALWYTFHAVPAGSSVTVRLRLRRDSPAPLGQPAPLVPPPFGPDFDAVREARRQEADDFYWAVIPAGTADNDALVARRAFAGLLWGKQLYRYNVRDWLQGDPSGPPPPSERADLRSNVPGRNAAWRHLDLAEVISMPDEWEYPWFASWDLAFHCVAMAHIDPEFAKNQLILLCREWATHPDGQLPAYEWAFGDVNPPVHAWAAWHVYRIDGGTDKEFLARVFSKLLLNFSWWVNRKDPDGSHLFEGGFLGMDNIGLFDRSKGLPPGHRLEQSDATSWMAFYCLGMMQIALELARTDRAWEDLAIKFLEHFLSIAEAMESFGSQGISLWNEADGFYYDVLIRPDGTNEQLPVRSMVGLLPLLAVGTVPAWAATELPDFTARLNWVRKHRPDLADSLIQAHAGDTSGAETRDGGTPDGGSTGSQPGNAATTMAILRPGRLERVLSRLLDEEEFLSPFGIRALSASYREPFTTDVEGQELSIQYLPAESDSGLFGGNSNWRGPVWFPVNVLLADALAAYAQGPGGELQVEMPAGSGTKVPLADVARSLRERLVALFRPADDGRRPGTPVHNPAGPLWDAHPSFSEYFNGDTGSGVGASHQTGWTALVAHIICTRETKNKDGDN